MISNAYAIFIDGSLIADHFHRNSNQCMFWKEGLMLWTVAVVLMVLWLLGLVTSYTLGGFIHVLFVLAVVMVLVRVIQGRRLT